MIHPARDPCFLIFPRIAYSRNHAKTASGYGPLEWAGVSAVSAARRSAAVQSMKRDFRETVQAHGNDGRACPDRCVSVQLPVAPGSGAVLARAFCIKNDRNVSRQSNLPAMGMPAKHHIETRIRRVPIDLGCVGQQNGHGIARNAPTRGIQVMCLEVVRVVHACEIDDLPAARNRGRFD